MAVVAPSDTQQECFWNRAIVPKPWLMLEKPPSSTQVFAFGAASDGQGDLFCTEDYVVYLDESGGDFSSDPRIRRAGWGLAFLPKRLGNSIPELNDACQLTAGFSGTVAGIVQSTPARCLDGIYLCPASYLWTTAHKA